MAEEVYLSDYDRNTLDGIEATLSKILEKLETPEANSERLNRELGISIGCRNETVGSEL